MKAVAFIRTSTDTQEIESQKKELISFIKRDGYSDEDIIIIGKSGASAIKEDEEYQAFKNELYSKVESGEVDCIYVWELSRLGRRRVTIDTIIEYLQQHKVNLKIFSPQLYLLEPDGSINNGMELAISMFTTFAEQEMRTKKERFRRAKQRNSEQGKYNGGSNIPFGYSLDSDNYFIINEEEAKIVLMCYNKYATGNYSMSSLGVEMRELGYDYIDVPWLDRVLKHTIYIGYQKKVGKDGKKIADRTYPRIVSDEVYNKVKSIREANFSGFATKEYKHFFFCNKLIKCQECGRSYIVYGTTYRCSKNAKHTLYKGDPCTNSQGISISMLDGLAWEIASFFEGHKMMKLNNKEKEDILLSNKELETKIHNLPKLIEKSKAKLDRAVDRNIDGTLSEEKFQSIKDKIKKEIQEYESKKVQYESQLTFNNNKINELDGAKVVLMDKASDAINTIYAKTEEEKQKLVHKFITEIKIYPQDKNSLVVDVKTIYGYLTCMIHPWSKWASYESMDGTPLLFNQVFRDRPEKGAYTIQDSIRWQSEGEDLTKQELKRIQSRNKWIEDSEKEGKFSSFDLASNSILFMQGLHQEAFKALTLVNIYGFNNSWAVGKSVN